MEDAPGSSGHSGAGEIRAHPLIGKFAEASKDDSVVELRGFIGPDDGDAIRLYTSLQLTECLLVPRDAIVHVREPKPEQANDQPTRVYVKGSTELRLISRHVATIRADEASPTLLASKPIEGVGTSFADFGGVGPAAECGDLLSRCLALAGSNFQRQIECISNYVKCMEIDRVG